MVLASQFERLFSHLLHYRASRCHNVWQWRRFVLNEVRQSGDRYHEPVFFKSDFLVMLM